MLGLSGRQRGFRVCKGDAITLLICYEEYVSFAHELIISNADIVDVSGNVGSDCNNVGTDPGVPSPRRIKVVARQIVAQQTSSNEQDDSEQNAYDSLHWEISVNGGSRPAHCHRRNKRKGRNGRVGHARTPDKSRAESAMRRLE